MKNKIYNLEEAGRIAEKLRSEGKRIVQCHGVFDLIHPGHIKHFEAAKKFGDVLFVTLTEDLHVNKGPGRPIFNEELRCENIAALEHVNYVAINRFPTAITAIEAIQPDFYVKGQDYKKASEDFTGGILEEKKKVEEFGGQLVFTEEIQFSSSKLINRHIDNKNDEINGFLTTIRKSCDFSKIKSYFDEISEFEVLIIGDIIIDEYQFVDPLGKASKSATITAKRLSSELYAGGVLAVANHIADFVKKVNLVTLYGDNFGTNYLDFIKSKLNSKISLHAVYDPDRPTVLKKRFVEKTFKHKLFEVSELDDSPLNVKVRNQLLKTIHKLDGKQDMTLIADFGHGLIEKKLVNEIVKLDTFLSVNTQTNSANSGYNLLTKYPRCDYFSIDQEEAKLALHNKHGEIFNILARLMEKNHAKMGVVTLGTNGSLIRNAESGKYVKAPVLSTDVVDTIGAGDAYLSITSLLAKLNIPIEEMVLVGNAVGAMAVKILGNKSYIEKVALLKYLKTLLT